MEVDADAEEILNADSLKCELNTLSRADGSSVLCQNKTVMAAAVYGPVEVKHHKMLIDKAYIEVIYKPKCGISQIGDRLFESIIGSICETAILSSFYPRTAIYLIIQELQDCGATLACSINSTCLALIHAGVAMNFLFAAVTCEIHSDQNQLSQFQQENRKSEITFVFENTSDRILAVDSYGEISEVEYKDCLKKCRNSSKVIFKFYQDMISKYATKM
ncbi:hypothetical protein V9T40_011843 [Parthenolecanium corni]|uniref:Exoribonuclease phosphorolytic domain-containing protein n=1 Tax=Parthenolecanium corni TaxID=536013 RepID=A0AAN9T625_9HEMI